MVKEAIATASARKLLRAFGLFNVHPEDLTRFGMRRKIDQLKGWHYLMVNLIAVILGFVLQKVQNQPFVEEEEIEDEEI